MRIDDFSADEISSKLSGMHASGDQNIVPVEGGHDDNSHDDHDDDAEEEVN